MKIILKSNDYLQFIERAKASPDIRIGNVTPKGSSYEVEYYYADPATHPPGQIAGVSTVLGSISAKAQSSPPAGGKGVCEGNPQNDVKPNAGQLGTAQAKRAVEQERGTVHSAGDIMAESGAMARYLDIDCGDCDERSRPDANRETDSQRGIPPNSGGHESDSGQLCGTPDVEQKGYSGIPAAPESEKPIEADARIAQVECPECGTFNDENKPCEICEALSGLFAICKRNAREYHALKSGERADAQR